MIELRIDGDTFNGFTSITMTDAIDQLCNQLTCSCTSDDGAAAFPVPRNARVELWVGDFRLMKGVIEINEGSYSSEDYDIKVDGRDTTRAVLKNDLPPNFVVKGPIQLKAVLEKCLKAVGLSIAVLDETDGISDYTDKELLTDDVGASMWEFWLGLAEKRKVLITKDADGNIVIRNPNDRAYPGVLRQLLSDPANQNNILRSSWRFDDTDRRHEYNVYSQVNVSIPRTDAPPVDGEYYVPENGPGGTPDVTQNQAAIEALQAQLQTEEPGTETSRVIKEQIAALSGDVDPTPQIVTKRVQTRGRAIDESVEPGSVSHETAEHPSDNDECQRLAEWACNRKRVESNRYSCSVEQLLIDGEPWKAGYLIQVIDEIAGIDSQMLISRVEYSTRVGEKGEAEEIATLHMTIPDGYSQNANASDSQKQTGIVGDKWVGEFQ
jgi:prophage tail gpP-like protein